MLTIGEELLLLTIDDEKGVVGTSTTTRDMITPALASAALMELVLASRIAIEHASGGFFTLSTAKGWIVVTNPDPTGDEILDDVLAAIHAEKKKKSTFHWLKKTTRFTVSKDAPAIDRTMKGSRYLDRMAGSGILYRKEHRIMGAIPSWRYKVIDAGSRDEVAQRARAAFDSGEPPDAKTAMLISLAVLCRVAGSFLPPGDRRQVKQRLTAIRESHADVDLLSGEARRLEQSRDATVMG